MVEFYLVVCVIFSFVWAIGTAISILEWSAIDKHHKQERQKAARVAIGVIMALPAIWLFPLTVPVFLLYLVVRVAKDAFPEKFNKN